MKIELTDFQKFISQAKFYSNQVVPDCNPPKFEEFFNEIILLETKAQFLKEENEKLYKPYNNAKHEIRRNVLNVASSYDLNLYKNYLKKYLDEIIFELPVECFVPFPEERRYEDEFDDFGTYEPPFLNYKQACNYFYETYYNGCNALKNLKQSMLNEVDNEIRYREDDTSVFLEVPVHKLKWNGTPAQFGFIVDLLIQGDYLEKPASSFVKTAELLLQHFDIATTKGTLSKEISERSNSLSTLNRKEFKIPPKKTLS